MEKNYDKDSAPNIKLINGVKYFTREWLEL